MSDEIRWMIAPNGNLLVDLDQLISQTAILAADDTVEAYHWRFVLNHLTDLRTRIEERERTE